MNVFTHRHGCAHALVEGPNKYRENLKKAAIRNWAVLTALVHQQTTMQSRVKRVLLFFARTELQTFLHFYTYCISGRSPLSAVVK